MLDHLQRINFENPGSIGEQISWYLGVSHTPDDDGNSTNLYSGSAGSIVPLHGLVGEARRIAHDHQGVLSLGYEEICRRRKERAVKSCSSVLFIHGLKLISILFYIEDCNIPDPLTFLIILRVTNSTRT